MRTLISILATAPSQLQLVHVFFADPKNIFEVLQLPWSEMAQFAVSQLTNEWIWGTLATVISTWWFWEPLKRLLRRVLPYLNRAVGLPFVQSEAEQMERAYLDWMKDHLPEPLPHEQNPISIPATLRPKLVRFSTTAPRHPLLKEIGQADRDEFRKGSTIRNLVKELRHQAQNIAIVLGDPGSGKSVCLRQLASDICDQQIGRIGLPKTLPIFVEMKAYDRWEDTSNEPLDILEFLKKSLRTHSSRSVDPKHSGAMYVVDNLATILREGRATLIFDALDEMPQESYRQRTDALRKFVDDWSKYGPGNRFVFSCRWLDYNDAFPVNEIVIEPFDKARIKQYFNEYLKDPSSTDEFYQTIEEKETLREAVTNPFFLHALTEIKNRNLTEIPSTRGDLIKTYIGILLDDIESQHSAKLAEINGGLPALRGFLAELGFAMQQTGTSARPENLRLLWEKYPQWQQMVVLARKVSILRDEPVYTGPIKDTPTERIEFKHHRFQEYFAAEALADRFNRGESIEQYLKDIWWQEVVLFAIASVNDTHAIIKLMLSLRQETEDWIEAVLAQAKDPFAKGETEKEPLGETITVPMQVVTSLLSEIQENCEAWRATHSDLPLTLLILSRIIRVGAELPKDSPAKAVWDALIMRGDILATRRDLFIVTEAIGHIPPADRGADEERITNELAIVRSQGEDLHKVRALRALSFIASEKCVPVLEKGLEEVDPWVQTTALRTLLRLDLRSQKPRAVLNAFLVKKFSETVTLERLGSEHTLLPETARYFQFNRGLLAALIKERGGKRAIPLTLLLWFASSLITAVVGSLYLLTPLVMFAIGAPVVIAVIVVFIGFMALVLAAVVAGLIISAPVWPRGLFGEAESRAEVKKLLVQLIVFAALDYILAGLLLLQGWPHGILRPGIFLGVFVLLLGVSWPINLQNPKRAERVRSVISFLVAAVFGWLGNRSPQLGVVTVAIFGFAALHGIRILWWLFAPVIKSPRQTIEKAVYVFDVCQRFVQRLLTTGRQAPPAFKANFENVRRASTVASRSPFALPDQAVRASDRVISVSKRRNLRPRRKQVIIAVSIIVAFLGAKLMWAYFAAKLLSLGPQVLALGPWFRSVPVLHKYYLYGFAGLLCVLGYCCLAAICIWFAWDEIKIVETIRLRAMAKGDVQQEKTTDFVDFMFQIIRDPNRETRDRVQAVSALRSRYPRWDDEYLQKLRVLAREDLPIRVIAAIQQALEARLRDLDQSKAHSIEIDPEELNKTVEAYWKMQRGSVLRPAIYKTLYAVLVSSLFAAILNVLLYLSNNRMTDGIALFESIAGAALIYHFLHTAGSQSLLRKWLFMIGLILTAVGLTHPVQSFLLDASWPNIAINAGLERIDSPTLRALVVPTIVACLIAQLGHTIYLLESNADIETKAEGRVNFFSRRHKRLKAKSSDWQ